MFFVCKDVQNSIQYRYMNKRLGTIEERLLEYVNKTDTCWLWVGYKGHYGYGKITNEQGKQVRAHRYMYEKYKGKIPEGMKILHKCDVTACVNPDHLFLGTQKDNVKDMMDKNRGGYKSFHGEKHWASKLTMEQVERIREMYALGDYYQSQLAKKFGVSQQVISKVVNYKAWTKNGTTLVKKVNI